MRIDYLASDILLFHGDSLSSLATAFIDGDRVLLIDALASLDDARTMRDYLEQELNKRVETIVLTHCDSDHIAGVALFPQARVVVQRQFNASLLTQQPTVVDQATTLQWGAHTLELFSNPGKTADTLAIDVASAGLLFVADNIVGNIAYLGAAAPEQLDAALLRLQGRGRERIVPGHIGVQDGDALANARHYLARLRERVGRVRAAMGADAARQAIAAIRIEDLLAPGVHAGRFERHWHGQNLLRVNERSLFAASGAVVQREERAALAACCDTVLRVLQRMLGGLARI